MVLVPCSVPQKCSSFQGSAAQMSLLADMCQPPCACTGAALLPNSESLKKPQKTVTESKACASDPREWVRMVIAAGGKEGMLPSELWEAGWVPCPFPVPRLCLAVLVESPLPLKGGWFTAHTASAAAPARLGEHRIHSGTSWLLFLLFLPLETWNNHPNF